MDALWIIVAFIVGLFIGAGIGGALTMPRVAEARLEGFTQAMTGIAEFVEKSQREQVLQAMETTTKGKKVN